MVRAAINVQMAHIVTKHIVHLLFMIRQPYAAGFRSILTTIPIIAEAAVIHAAKATIVTRASVQTKNRMSTRFAMTIIQDHITIPITAMVVVTDAIQDTIAIKAIVLLSART